MQKVVGDEGVRVGPEVFLSTLGEIVVEVVLQIVGGDLQIPESLLVHRNPWDEYQSWRHC